MSLHNPLLLNHPYLPFYSHTLTLSARHSLTASHTQPPEQHSTPQCGKTNNGVRVLKEARDGVIEVRSLECG